MSLFTKLANAIFSPVDAAGHPRSVLNGDAQVWGTELERLIMALVAGEGGDIDLPNLLILFTITGGTADAIEATPNLPLPDAPGEALFSIQIVQDNTGPVTINGKPLRTNSGNEISPAGLLAGGVYLFMDQGAEYRLVSDQASAAIVAAAEAARDAALAAVPNAFPVDRAALKALDTNSITAAYLKEQGWEGQWLWDAAVPIATHQADDFEQRYIAPDPAEDGSWVRAGSVQTGGRFTNDSPAPRIHRFADRVFVGDAVAYNGARDGDAEGSWLFDDTGGTHTRAYMEAAAQFASTASAGIAVSGAARSMPETGTSIGILGFAMNTPGSGLSETAYGAYIEGVRAAGAATAWGMELNIVNLGPSPNGEQPFTPFGGPPGGIGATLGLWLASGGDPAVNPVVYDADVGIVLVSNGGKFLSGITFMDNALFRDGGGFARAILLSQGHMQTWYEPATQAPAFTFGSNVSEGGHEQRLFADNSGLRYTNGDLVTQLLVTNTEDSVSGLNIVPGGPGGPLTLLPVGDASDINMIVRGKGSGSVFLLDAVGNVNFTSGPSGIGFYGTSPIAKQTGVPVTAEGVHAALVSLGLISA